MLIKIAQQPSSYMEGHPIIFGVNKLAKQTAEWPAKTEPPSCWPPFLPSSWWWSESLQISWRHPVAWFFQQKSVSCVPQSSQVQRWKKVTPGFRVGTSESRGILYLNFPIWVCSILGIYFETHHQLQYEVLAFWTYHSFPQKTTQIRTWRLSKSLVFSFCPLSSNRASITSGPAWIWLTPWNWAGCTVGKCHGSIQMPCYDINYINASFRWCGGIALLWGWPQSVGKKLSIESLFSTSLGRCC